MVSRMICRAPSPTASANAKTTPPNVIETDAATWVALATGSLTWADALAAGSVSASGSRADLSAHLPVRWLREQV